MKAIVLGLGTQGNKRKKILLKKNSYYCSIDPINKRAEFQNLNQIVFNKFDTVFICTPDFLKERYIFFFLKNKKNIFVEKPLKISSKKLSQIKKLSKKNKSLVYVGYNHRFEPHFVRLKKLIKNNTIGKLLYLNIVYGNGTSKLVANSWRNKNLSIFDDIGSHIIDLIFEWFGVQDIKKIKVIKSKLENNFDDHIVVYFILKNDLKINIQISYCYWKNDFKLNLIGKKGSILINNLCKWGASKLEIHKRVYPSGIPIIKTKIIKQRDPTWKKEVNYFRNCIKNNIKFDDFREKKINQLLHKIQKSR